MGIRSTAKAIIVRDEAILLNRCVIAGGKICYDLPGGGQNRFETLEEAVIREVEEETGYRVTILRFAALLELIFDQTDQEDAGDYAHWVVHIFIAELISEEERDPTVWDWRQSGSEWIPLREADSLCVRPAILRGRLSALATAETACYLGADHVNPGD